MSFNERSRSCRLVFTCSSEISYYLPALPNWIELHHQIVLVHDSVYLAFLRDISVSELSDFFISWQFVLTPSPHYLLESISRFLRLLRAKFHVHGIYHLRERAFSGFTLLHLISTRISLRIQGSLSYTLTSQSWGSGPGFMLGFEGSAHHCLPFSSSMARTTPKLAP